MAAKSYIFIESRLADMTLKLLSYLFVSLRVFRTSLDLLLL